MWKTFLIVGFWLGLTACQSPKRYQSFTPGELWLDDKNVHINAHGGGILFENGRYYWFGEHKTAGDGGKRLMLVCIVIRPVICIIGRTKELFCMSSQKVPAVR